MMASIGCPQELYSDADDVQKGCPQDVYDNDYDFYMISIRVLW